MYSLLVTAVGQKGLRALVPHVVGRVLVKSGYKNGTAAA